MHPWVAGSYQSVRLALDPSLTADTLPDDIIEDDAFLLPALQDLERLDEDALTYAETTEPAEYRGARLALLYLVAAQIAPVLPVITAERLGDRQYARAAWNGDALAGRLRGKAAAAIAAYKETDGVVPVPTLFATASGRRGR